MDGDVNARLHIKWKAAKKKNDLKLSKAWSDTIYLKMKEEKKYDRMVWSAAWICQRSHFYSIIICVFLFNVFSMCIIQNSGLYSHSVGLEHYIYDVWFNNTDRDWNKHRRDYTDYVTMYCLFFFSFFYRTIET